MGRILLVCRLAARDLRRRSGEAVLLLLVIMAATTTLTLGLVLHGVTTSASYQSTRAATAGPAGVARGGAPRRRDGAGPRPGRDRPHRAVSGRQPRSAGTRPHGAGAGRGARPGTVPGRPAEADPGHLGTQRRGGGRAHLRRRSRHPRR